MKKQVIGGYSSYLLLWFFFPLVTSGYELNLSVFRWSDTSNMKNQVGQLMRFGAKFPKSYPWLNWWLTVRKGCLKRNLTVLAYVQTRLPLEPYRTLSTQIGFNILWNPVAQFCKRISRCQEHLIKRTDRCAFKCSHTSLTKSYGTHITKISDTPIYCVRLLWESSLHPSLFFN